MSCRRCALLWVGLLAPMLLCIQMSEITILPFTQYITPLPSHPQTDIKIAWIVFYQGRIVE